MHKYCFAILMHLLSLDFHLFILIHLSSSGKQFQTINVQLLLHLPEVVGDLGPLWSNFCFPFEDSNGDLRDLFHGTKNVDGEVCLDKVLIISYVPKVHDHNAVDSFMVGCKCPLSADCHSCVSNPEITRDCNINNHLI